MLKLEELHQMWETDANIDKLELSDESLKTQKLHAKYVVHLARTKLLLRNAEKDFTKMRNLRWEWYRGTLAQEDLKVLGWKPWLKATPLKSEMEDILNADEILSKLQDKMVLLTAIYDMLLSIMKSIGSRGWDIKNSIEFTKFTNGLL